MGTIQNIKNNVVRYAHQAGTITLAKTIGTEQSPLLSRLFDQNAGLAPFFNTLFKTAIIVGASLAVIRLMYAGAVYMTTDLWPQKQGSTRIIQEAVMGLLLLLSIWIILNQINPDLLNLNILKSIKTQPQQSSQGAGTPQQPVNGNTDVSNVFCDPGGSGFCTSN